MSFITQQPIENCAARGATRLSSSATLFVPRWSSTAHSTASMCTLADDGSNYLTPQGSTPEGSINFPLQSTQFNAAMQATQSTRTPSSNGDQNESEVEVGQEEIRDAAIHAWVRNASVAYSKVTGGLQDVGLQDAEAGSWPGSAVPVNDGLHLEPPPPLIAYGDKTPSLYDSPRCCTDDPLLFPATPDTRSDVSDFDGLGDHCRPSAESALPQASMATVGHFGQSAQAAAASVPTPSSSLVMVQVPVQLLYGVHTPLGNLPPNVNVAILSQESDTTTGAVSLEMRMVLSPPGMSQEVQEVPPPTCKPRSRRWLQHAAKPVSLPGARASPGAVAAEKRDMVCVHWKAKGWCKYEDSCKFMHSKEKCVAPNDASEKTAKGCKANI